MTAVFLHGILAKEFGQIMAFRIRKPKEVFSAIDANRPNFIKRIFELAQEGVHYNIIADGKNIKEFKELDVTKVFNKIDIVPTIVGQGPALALVGVVAMMGSAFIPSIAVASVVGMVGSLLLSVGLQMMLAPKPETQRQESNVSAVQESFSFSSKANIAQQGIPVPVGYGRLRVGSVVIQTTIKSFPEKFKRNEAMGLDLDTSKFSNQAIISSYTDNK